jgi:hypothetical protein
MHGTARGLHHRWTATGPRRAGPDGGDWKDPSISRWLGQQRAAPQGRTIACLLVVSDLSRTGGVLDSTEGRRLVDFDRDAVVPIARRGLTDPSADVRWSANFDLFQFGLSRSLDPTLETP